MEEKNGKERSPGPAQILLVEDHPDSAELISMLLSWRGWEVRTAATLAEALECGRTAAFDVVISDLSLPDGSGLELPSRLGPLQAALRGAAPPMVAMSGYGSASDRERSHGAGFALHLTKPVEGDALEQHVEALLVQSGTGVPAGG